MPLAFGYIIDYVAKDDLPIDDNLGLLFAVMTSHMIWCGMVNMETIRKTAL